MAAAFAAAVGTAVPAAAQQASEPWMPLPRPAESGTVIIYEPQLVAKGKNDQHQGCSPALQCRLQLLGVIERYGAVELRATAFSW